MGKRHRPQQKSKRVKSFPHTVHIQHRARVASDASSASTPPKKERVTLNNKTRAKRSSHATSEPF